MELASNEQEVPLWKYLYASRTVDEELAYREHFLDNDRRQVSTIIIVTCAYLLTFTLLDLQALDENPVLITGIYLRTFFVIVGIALFFFMWTVKHYRAVDVSVLIFSASISVGLVLFHMSGEFSGIRTGTVIIVYILVSYIGFPTYASLISLPVLINCLGEAFLVFTPEREYLLLDQPFMAASALFSIFFGTCASAYHHRARYNSFRSMREVKLLSGLLPICANCKKIRDEEGDYQALEHYITEHSEAFFTHGICPECKMNLYPELGNSRDS